MITIDTVAVVTCIICNTLASQLSPESAMLELLFFVMLLALGCVTVGAFM